MWNRKDLKAKAKTAFSANYWMSVLAGFIISIFATAGGNSGRNATSSYSTANNSNASGIAGVLFLAVLLAVIGVLIVVAIVKIIVGNALIVGSQKLFICNEKNPTESKFNTLVFVFSNGHWKNVALTMFLKDLFTSLWTLLFVIPGIVKSYEYRMIPYLLAENPEMSHKEAFAKSKEMMNGHKWNAFVLDLSFFGWFLLTVITLGIVGIFYVYPYFYQTSAELYLALKENA